MSTQSQILNLFAELQEKLGLTYLFISHGLTVVKHVSSRIAVMYLGKIVEVGDSDEIYRNPLHPYTKALFSAIPIPDPFSRKEKVILSGDVPNPVDLPKGCRFASRCPYATDRCHEEEPELANADSGHLTACYLYESAGQEEKGA